MEKKSDEKRLENIPLVREFPKELPGLPRVRQVEFQIDLILRAAPVARAPYRLAPSEMQELSNQLQELADRGFIRLRLAGYYRRFIKDFSKIAKSLTILTQKDKKFVWGKDQEMAFQKLKQKLCEALILALPEGNDDFVIYCDTLIQECQKPSGLLIQPKIPIWKWERITMDFVTKLPRTLNEHDTIWVVVDRLTKSVHFIPTREIESMDTLTWLYIKETISCHGVPISIISDRESHFTSRFWQSLQNVLGTQLDMSTAYHPETDGQSERTIQTLEDMLRACAIDFGKGWEKHLPLVEFSYNNSYHAGIKATPFKALYERMCRSHVYWAEFGDT
nr:reverse transcriptase domain-containing protein [Tanacetum cinerariifolium]